MAHDAIGTPDAATVATVQEKPVDSAAIVRAEPMASTAIEGRADGSASAAGGELDVARVPRANPVQAYLLSLPSENSRRTMIDALKRVVRTTNYHPDDYENVPWHALGPEHANVIRARLLGGTSETGRPYSRATVLVSLAALRGVLEQAFTLELIDAERYHRTRIVLKKHIAGGSDERAGRMLTDDEVLTLRRTCLKMGPFEGAMYDAMLALALGAGLRRHELARIRLEDVSDDARRVRVHGKGNKVVTVDLPSWGAGALEAWMAQRASCPFKHDALLVRIVETPSPPRPGRRRAPERRAHATVPMTKWCVSRAMERLSRLAGVKFTPHDLRRTFISTMLEATDTATAQGLARHSDPKTTFRYDRRPAKRRAEAVERGLAKWGKL